MRQDTLLARLLRFVNTQNKDINHDIACIMLKHYDELSCMTINELADICFVSTASISRFVKALGYDSILEFKEESKNTLQIKKTDYSPSFIKSDKKDISHLFDLYTNNVIKNIISAKESLGYEQLDNICQTIKSSNEVLILGLEFSTLLSQHIQNRFALMDKFVEVALSFEEQLEAANQLKEGSTVIILSLEGGFFYRREEVINILRRKNVKLILITMFAKSKLINEFENKQIILCGNNNDNTEGRVAMLYILEIIIMYYCIYYSFSL